MELPFEIVGSLPEEWSADLSHYAAALAEHPWGGASLKRLVIGDIDAPLRDWMPTAEYERWRATQSVRSVVTGGKCFVAKDGQRTAVVPPLTERLLFVYMPCHEMVETALDERLDREGYTFVDSTHWGGAHVLWTEYVVERTRRSLCNDLGWEVSALDDGFLVDHVRQFQDELSDLARWAAANNADPMESHQHWFELVRVYAMSRGRADAGSPADEAAFSTFFAETLPAELEPQWRALDDSFRDAYQRPTASAQELDESVHDDGWRPLYDEYRSIWSYLVRLEKKD